MRNLEQLTENGIEEVADVDLFELDGPTGPIPYGIDKRGTIFLSSDLHPGGANEAMARAAEQGIPWVMQSAVQVLFPAEWLAAEALGEPVRSSIIPSLVAVIRSRG